MKWSLARTTDSAGLGGEPEKGCVDIGTKEVSFAPTQAVPPSQTALPYARHRHDPGGRPACFPISSKCEISNPREFADFATLQAELSSLAL